jgi:hypothetical protein
MNAPVNYEEDPDGRPVRDLLLVVAGAIILSIGIYSFLATIFQESEPYRSVEYRLRLHED